MEIYLSVFIAKDQTFRVYRSIAESHNMRDSVLKLDYNYTPWSRYNGNLLWQ